MPELSIENLRRCALECFGAGLRAVRGRPVVRAHLTEYPLQGPAYLIAVGKAAPAMAMGALDAAAPQISRGIVITKYGHLDPALRAYPQLECLEAGHPMPDEGSLRAGRRMAELIQSAPAEARLLFLVSGGASSLVEVLPPGIELAQLHRLNDWLLASGLRIDQVNAVRKGVSCIKGGRLAERLGGRDARLLLISDVRGDDPRVIGSGLLVPDPEPPPLPAQLPEWVRALLARAPSPPRTRPSPVDVRIVARLGDAVDAVVQHARAHGWAAVAHDRFLDGDAEAAGRRVAGILRQGPAGVHVWGGETTVALPSRSGRGGRCQQLALAAAGGLGGMAHTVLLAAGTDGSDGPTEDAGALVDGETVERIRWAGLDAATCLVQANAGTCLEAAGDLVQTGPTGTNVMDLVIGVNAAMPGPGE